MTSHQALREKALKATEGPLVVRKREVPMWASVGLPMTGTDFNSLASFLRDEDAEYFAAANPTAILELLDKYDAALAEIRTLHADLQRWDRMVLGSTKAEHDGAELAKAEVRKRLACILARATSETPADSVELLPCPFCGAGTTTFNNLTHGSGQVLTVRLIHHCGGDDWPCVEFSAATKAEAIEAWNRRASPIEAPGQAWSPPRNWAGLVSDEDMRHLLEAKDVGTGRGRLQVILRKLMEGAPNAGK